MNLSEILKEVGNEGLFQILALIALTMPKMPIQWSMTMMSFASYTPHWCCTPADVVVDENCESFQPDNSSVVDYRLTYQHCDLNATQCSRRIYLDPEGASTAVTEWELVCDKSWIISGLSAVQMGGVMIGALVSGYLSELFGRKKVHFASILMHALLNVGAGFSDSWELFAVFSAIARHFTGIFSAIARHFTGIFSAIARHFTGIFSAIARHFKRYLVL
ncbi:hypothetical protein Btru_032876 [Bulinus truncatus]|nr:hypothetical protein Btru_032876 [Bulinus truncatus]